LGLLRRHHQALVCVGFTTSALSSYRPRLRDRHVCRAHLVLVVFTTSALGLLILTGFATWVFADPIPIGTVLIVGVKISVCYWVVGWRPRFGYSLRPVCEVAGAWVSVLMLSPFKKSRSPLKLRNHVIKFGRPLFESHVLPPTTTISTILSPSLAASPNATPTTSIPALSRPAAYAPQSAPAGEVRSP
jgi:hypothetical protein